MTERTNTLDTTEGEFQEFRTASKRRKTAPLNLNKNAMPEKIVECEADNRKF